ncbi:MAG: DMT family transporter [Flavobacteriaceae bacterium]|nr:DMT family transporter [Flavobacteriaceae bacterium]
MLKSNLKHYVHLHFIVFLWGFTAILGKLISINTIPLVWFRLLIATLILFTYLLLIKTNFKVAFKDLVRFFIGGVIIALHWLSFFYAIKISNISITLVGLATGVLFVSLLEPIFFRTKVKPYEILLASLTTIGIIIIFNVETNYYYGIAIALIAAFLSALFTIVNSIYIKQYKATVLTAYELLFATITISIFMLFKQGFSTNMFHLIWQDWLYVFILGSICTAYALTASSKLLKKISPFTMMLTINLEPVYGIFLALVVFGNSEKMNTNFYYGAILIFITVILNAFIKTKENN